jgi:hypothetical protein
MKKKESVVVENEEEVFAKNYYYSAAPEKERSKSDGGNDNNNNKIEDHFTVACVNAFLVNASRNLNDIHAKSRKEVQKIEEKMRKMERSLVFLEKKLEGFEDDDVAKPVPAEFGSVAPSSSEAEAPPPPPPPSPPPPPRNDDDADDEEEEEEDNRIEKKEASSVVVNPMHEKYHKMIRIGVPEQAVRNKMKLDGVDDSGVVF